MKKIFFPTITALLVVSFIFFSCKKEKPISSVVVPLSIQKKVKARVVEYGNDLPVVGATVSVCTSPNADYTCIDNKLILITDANGECLFNADKFRDLTISKENYWVFNDEVSKYWHIPFSEIFPGNVPLVGYPRETTFSCDSLVIKLIPEVFITLHIKDSSHSWPYNTFLNCFGRFTTPPGFVFPTIDDSNAFVLRSNIDTACLYRVFGNIWNDIFVGPDPFTTFFQHDMFIAKGSNISLNVIY